VLVGKDIVHDYIYSLLLIICFINRMVSADKQAADRLAYIGQIVMYGVLVWLAVTVMSFFVGIIRIMPCSTAPINAYEHFQDANTINKHILDSLTKMSETLTTTQNNLQDAITNTTSMKVQSCVSFDGLHDKFIASYAKEANNADEYNLPQSQQDQIVANRAKNGVDNWNLEVGTFQLFHKKPMLNCAAIDISGTKVSGTDMSGAEGFQDANSGLETLAQTVQQKTSMFNTLLGQPVVINWLSDCDGIGGTADFVKRYVHNAQVKAQTTQCISDKQKAVGDFKKKSAEDQGKLTDLFNTVCHLQFDRQLEPFQNYVNNQFSFPVPFPTSSLSQDQQRYYSILSQAQDAINKFKAMVNTRYQAANASYTVMSATQQAYNAYMAQLNSAQNHLTSDSAKTLS